MLGATHTKVLLEIVRLVGCRTKLLSSIGGSAMIFGNLLPDNLPIVGVSPEFSHSLKRAEKLAESAPPLGVGAKIHILTDNLTHCGSVLDNGDYGASPALKFGVELMSRTENKYLELVKRFSPRSPAYTLHTIIELAVDVSVAENGNVVEIIEKAWNAAAENKGDSLKIIADIYGMEPNSFIEKSNYFLSREKPLPKNIYSRKARAELFIWKFAPKPYDADLYPNDHDDVMDLIEAGEKMLNDQWRGLVQNFAERILDHDRALGDKLAEILELNQIHTAAVKKGDEI